MASRDILFCGDPVLRKKAKRVSEITDGILQLLDDMAQTMIEAPGLGLAAPQVGESVRAIVCREDATDEAEVLCLLNPRVVRTEGEVEAIEGCLSLPTLQGLVTRSELVVVEAMTPAGEIRRIEAGEMLARALQHEIDHLNGVLFLDRVDEDTLGWMIPDEDEEDGYRLEPATVQEVLDRFEQMRKRKERG